jgi:hypothetical protein
LFRNQTVSLGVEKNGDRLFRRPKLILSCSAEGKEGIFYSNTAFVLEVDDIFKCISKFWHDIRKRFSLQ